MLLYGQSQEDLRLEIVLALAVSGAQSYAQLYVAAKNEQHRQGEFHKCSHTIMVLVQLKDQSSVTAKYGCVRLQEQSWCIPRDHAQYNVSIKWDTSRENVGKAGRQHDQGQHDQDELGQIR